MTEIVHRDDCIRPKLQRFTGAQGDKLERCLGCRRFRVLTDADLTPDERTPASNYYCREHLDQPVNWRGKGCPPCDQPRKRARKRPTDDHTPTWEKNA